MIVLCLQKESLPVRNSKHIFFGWTYPFLLFMVMFEDVFLFLAWVQPLFSAFPPQGLCSSCWYSPFLVEDSKKGEPWSELSESVALDRIFSPFLLRLLKEMNNVKDWFDTNMEMVIFLLTFFFGSNWILFVHLLIATKIHLIGWPCKNSGS